VAVGDISKGTPMQTLFLGLAVAAIRALKKSPDPVKLAEAITKIQFEESEKCYLKKTETH
jgi:hypothetical protein